MTASIRVEPVVAVPLGSTGAELADYLWPGRCQTCGEGLDGAPESTGVRSAGPGPSHADEVVVAVDEGESAVQATLHHRRCRPPEWRRGSSGSPAGEYVTCSATAVLLPLAVPGVSGPVVALVINPSLERMLLNPGAHPVWRADLARFHAAGLRAPGREQVPVDPVPGQWRVDGDRLTVALPLTGRRLEEFSATVSPQVRRTLGEQGRLLLAVTHAVDPGRLTGLEDLGVAMLTGRVLCAWIGAGPEPLVRS